MRLNGHIAPCPDRLIEVVQDEGGRWYIARRKEVEALFEYPGFVMRPLQQRALFHARS